MTPLFFSNTAEFRKWLEENHQAASEVLVGYYKIKTGKLSMTWSDSVDEALCFGWIDGIRRSIDEQSYSIRFTPRLPTSNWSKVNIDKAEELIQQGRMQPAGLTAFNKRTQERSERYSYENRPEKLTEELEAIFRQHEPGWEFFNEQSPSYQRTMIYWILSARQASTQKARLSRLIESSQKKIRLI